MRIFVTGASGWIGSPTVTELLRAGHQVVGLARSDASAAKVAALGAEVRRGDLEDLDGLRAAAASAAATARIGPSAAGATSSASTMRASNISEPANSTSRLSAKCRKNVLLVRPARSAICATVVAS